MIPVLEASDRSVRMSTRVPVTTLTPQSTDLSLWGMGTSNAVAVTEQSAMTLSHFWAGITLISEAMCTMPVKVWRTRKGGGKDHADQHPSNYCLTTTNNGWMTPSVFKSFAQGCLLMSGNIVGEVVRNGRGQCAAIHPWLPRNTMYGVDYDDTPMYGVLTSSTQSLDMPVVSFRERNVGKPEWFPHTEVIHIKGFSSDGYMGKSILAAARGSLSLSLTVEQFGQRFFTKGRPAGFLTKVGNMTTDQRDLLREEWKELYEGVEKALSIGVLSNGLDWKTMGYTNDDAQFLQTRVHQVLEVARWLRIPPHMLAEMSSATEANIEQLMLEFITFTLLPWMTRWEEELNLKLFTPMEQFNYQVEFDIDAFLRGDKLTQAKADEMHIRNGQRTIDETRERDGFNPYEDETGSKPLIIASQLDTLENVIKGTSKLQGGDKAAPAKAAE